MTSVKYILAGKLALCTSFCCIEYHSYGQREIGLIVRTLLEHVHNGMAYVVLTFSYIEYLMAMI